MIELLFLLKAKLPIIKNKLIKNKVIKNIPTPKKMPTVVGKKTIYKVCSLLANNFHKKN